MLDALVDDQLLRAVPVLAGSWSPIRKLVVNKGANSIARILTRGIMRRIGGEAAILVVDRAHRLAVRGHVAKAIGGDLPG